MLELPIATEIRKEQAERKDSGFAQRNPRVDTCYGWPHRFKKHGSPPIKESSRTKPRDGVQRKTETVFFDPKCRGFEHPHPPSPGLAIFPCRERRVGIGQLMASPDVRRARRRRRLPASCPDRDSQRAAPPDFNPNRAPRSKMNG
ncbi:hypothetical protein BHM03_00010808 [Ensete ventricosum]|nr:hypothetical protein BHM03_00010808 [Ensete ventricosum]